MPGAFQASQFFRLQIQVRGRSDVVLFFGVGSKLAARENGRSISPCASNLPYKQKSGGCPLLVTYRIALVRQHSSMVFGARQEAVHKDSVRSYALVEWCSGRNNPSCFCRILRNRIEREIRAHRWNLLQFFLNVQFCINVNLTGH